MAPPRTSIRVNALATWLSLVGRIPGIRNIYFQMRIRNQLSSVSAADICTECPPFGEIAAKLSHIDAAHSLANTEKSPYAMLGRAELARSLSDSARVRISADYVSYLSETKGDIAKMAPRDDTTQIDNPKRRPKPAPVLNGERIPSPHRKGLSLRKGRKGKGRMGNNDADSATSSPRNGSRPTATTSDRLTLWQTSCRFA